MSINPLPLGKNTRVEITIQSWAISAVDGYGLSDTVYGIWFTQLEPLYSHPFAVENIAGNIVADVPHSLIKLAIFEASKYIDAISNDCPGRNENYFKEVRRKYATLKSILMIVSQTHGVNTVTKKVLGDFEIEFDNSSSDNNLITRILNDLAELEPIVISGGCLGIGTSYGPQGMVKGVSDPYRPIFGRNWYAPLEGEPGMPTGKYSPGHRTGTQYPNRWRNASNRLVNRIRRGR